MKCASEEATIKIYNETTAQWTSVSSKQVDFAKEVIPLFQFASFFPIFFSCVHISISVSDV